MDNEIINRINFSLQKCGISKTELANRVGMTYNGILKILQGKTQDIGISILSKIACALNTSVSYLIGEGEKQENEDVEQYKKRIAELEYIVELQKKIITQKG